MRVSIATTPADWLSRAPNPVANPGAVISCFGTEVPMRVFEFRGPHTLYRVAGWDGGRGGMADPYGCWWVDEDALVRVYAQVERLDQFQGWMSPEQLAQIQSLPLHYRALTAVCEDWNDFREQVVLRLPPGEVIQGLCGTAAPQPTRSSMDRRSRQTPWLPGGLEQSYIKRGSDRTTGINPLWVHWERLW